MQICKDFCEFEPWGAACDTWYALEEHGLLDRFEEELDGVYPSGVIGDTALNDLLAYDTAWVWTIVGVMYDEECAEPIFEEVS